MSYLDKLMNYKTQPEQALRVLVYGESKCGKSHFSGTFDRPLFLDFDGGGLTLRNKDIPAIDFIDGVDVCNQVKTLLNDCINKQGPFADGGVFADIKTLVIDSWTHMSNHMANDVMRLQDKYKIAHPNPKSEKPRTEIRDPLVVKPDYDDYNAILKGQQYIANLLRLVHVQRNMNIVTTALVDLDKDEHTGTLTGRPLCVGGYREIIASDYNEVYYLEATLRENKRVFYAHTAPYQFYKVSGTRLELPVRIENPSYAQLKGVLEKGGQ